MPGTVRGKGVFEDHKRVFTADGVDVICHPYGLFRHGRVAIATIDLESVYDLATDTLDDGTICCWRKFPGSPSDCP